MNNLINLFEQRVIQNPNSLVYQFYSDEKTLTQVTYQELYHQALVFASVLKGLRGERALLCLPTSADYLVAFWGCLFAHVIAVPLYPPRAKRFDARIKAIASDCNPRVVITSRDTIEQKATFLSQYPELARCEWLHVEEYVRDTNRISSIETKFMPRQPEQIAYLQYTSGSISQPKGVMISDANLLHNHYLIQQGTQQTSHSRIVSWLPLFHDLGLVNALQAIYLGATAYLLPSTAFLQRPALWLHTISTQQADYSGAAAFGYQLCVERISDADCIGLDLSSWKIAFIGAEKVRRDVLDNFVRKFAPFGFDAQSLYPAYGLAEATVAVSGGPPHRSLHSLHILSNALEKNQIVFAEKSSTETSGASSEIISCGKITCEGLSIDEHNIRIVNPSTLLPTGSEEVGEIWVAGRSVARGYWQNPDQTDLTFNNRLADEPQFKFLRTGDMGVVYHDELFVTGRLKEMILIHGRNLYPQDIESAVEQSGIPVQRGSGAAFSIERNSEEKLVIVFEVARLHRTDDLSKVADIVRRVIADQYGVQVYAFTLIRPNTLPKTSSGKPQRLLCRQMWLEKTLNVVFENQLEEIESTQQDYLGVIQVSHSEILAELTNQLANVLKLPSTAIQPTQAINTLGIDSLMAVGFKAYLEEHFGVSILVTQFLDGMNLNDLTSYVIQHSINQHSASPIPSAIDQLDVRTEAIKPIEQTAQIASETDYQDHQLTDGQRALWYLHRLAPESAAYNISFFVIGEHPLNITAMKNAVLRLAQRHDILRSIFPFVDGEPIRRVMPQFVGIINLVDAQQWNRVSLQNVLKETVSQPIDITSESAFKFTIYKTRQGFAIQCVLHHIIDDAWSRKLLLHDLSALYSEEIGIGLGLEAAKFQYRDYTEWLSIYLESAAGIADREYWLETLKGAPPILALPYDFSRPPLLTFEGQRVSVTVNEQLLRRLTMLAKECSTSLFTILSSAFAMLLHRWTGQTDIWIGSPTLGRTTRNWREVPGYMTNPVVLRVQLSQDMVLRELIADLRQTILEAIDHQLYPFIKLVQAIAPVRDSSYTPLFQVFFSFVQEDSESQLILNNIHHNVEVLLPDFSPFDLTLNVVQHENSLSLEFEYNTNLFAAETITRMATHFETILGALDTALESGIDKIPMLTPLERVNLLYLWNRAQYRYQTSDNHPFELLQKQQGTSIAARYHEQQITYAELITGAVPDELPFLNLAALVKHLASAHDRLQLHDMSDSPFEILLPALLSYWALLDEISSTHTLLSLTTFENPLEQVDLLWVLSRGGTIQFANSGPQTKHPLEFSLFYFSNNLPDRDPDKYRLLIEGAKFADSHDFKAIWTPERHFHSFGGIYPNPAVLGSALAMVTNQVRIRAGSVVLPLHHPIRVAEEWSVVDNLSGGRVDLAFATGWNANDFVLQPANYEMRRESFLDQIETVQKLWRGEVVDFVNGAGSATPISIYPLPVQPSVETWITTAGNPETYRQAGCIGAHILTNLLIQSNEQLRANIELYHATLLEHGYDPSRHHVTLMLHTFIADSLDEVRLIVREPFKRYLQSSVDLWSQVARQLNGLNESEQQDLIEYSVERYFQNSTLFGTVESAEQTALRFQSMGVNEIACLVDFGVPIDLTLAGLDNLDHLKRRMERHSRCQTQPVPKPTIIDIAVRQSWLSMVQQSVIQLLQAPTTIQAWFEQQVSLTPFANAVIFEDEILTYAELNRRATIWAARLHQAGVHVETPIGLMVERSLDMIIGLLAILKVGGSYVPLDPAYPESRLKLIAEDSQLEFVLTQRLLTHKVTANQLLYLDDPLVDAETINFHAPTLTHHNRAYILYTSGSTGQPKGVEIEHGAVVNLLRSMQQEPGIQPTDVLLAVTSIAFDIAALELFLPLVTGACVVIAPTSNTVDGKQINTYLDKHDVTIMQATPALWQSFIDTGLTKRPTLRALCGGESLPASLASTLLSYVNELWNMYGPTETTIWSTIQHITDPNKPISIGHPILNTQVYVLNGALELCPVGIEGNLYIAGAGLARGYLGKSELTAQRFIPNPFEPQTYMYATGDRAAWSVEGTLIYKGRSDHQLKIRGFRIEPAEVELAIRKVIGIHDCAVIGRSDVNSNNKHLAAFIVGDNLLSASDLRAELRQTLPDFMIPSEFVFLGALPLTANAKIDRVALQRFDVSTYNQIATSDTNLNPIENRLVNLWRSLLPNGATNVDTNFFDAGGHSLILIRMLTNVYDQFGVTITLPQYLQGELTIRRLANIIQDGTDTSTPEINFWNEVKLPIDLKIDKSNNINRSMHRVLLTGATGFLGVHLLQALLQRTDIEEIYCLVRADDEAHAMRRIQETMQRYDVQFTQHRVIPIIGDLREQQLGLLPEVFANLAERLDAIYHNGAFVNFIYPYHILKSTNVNSLHEVLGLSVEHHLKPVHYVSTAGVFPPSIGGRAIPSNSLPPYPDTLSSGYEQTKWVTENTIVLAREKGLKITIYRPSQLAGTSKRGIVNKDDLIWRLLRTCMNVRLAPDLSIELNIMPVDKVAQTLVDLSLTVSAENRNHNLVNPLSITWSNLIGMLNKIGYPIEVVSEMEWIKVVKKAIELDTNHPLKAFELVLSNYRGIPNRWVGLPRLEPSETCMDTIYDLNVRQIVDFMLKS